MPTVSGEIRMRHFWTFDGPKKGQKPTAALSLLGAQVAISPNAVEISMMEKKKQELIADLAHVLQARKLTPAGTAKLRGRLGFAQSCFYGKFGRAHLAPFSDRQFSKVNKGGFSSTQRRSR